MARRKRGNRKLPPGLYRHRVRGNEYWIIRKTVAKQKIRVQLGRTDELTEAEAIARYHEILASGPDAASAWSPSTSLGWTEFVTTRYLPHVEEHRARRTFEMERYAASWLSARLLDTPLDAISTDTCEQYKRWRRAHGGRRGRKGPRCRPSARTINLDLHVLSKALRHAVTLGLLERAPTIVKLPEARERRETPWHDARQMDAVIAAASPQRRLLLTFAYHTGMRPGEIDSRHKEDIDLDEGFIRVDHRGEFRVKKEKPRMVPISVQLERALRAAWDDLPAHGPIFAGQSLSQTLKRACVRAGAPHIPPYGTRHSFASRWAAEGRSRETLVKIMGHADGRMIDRVYAHFGSNELRAHMRGVQWGEEATVIPLRPASNEG